MYLQIYKFPKEIYVNHELQKQSTAFAPFKTKCPCSRVKWLDSNCHDNQLNCYTPILELEKFCPTLTMHKLLSSPLAIILSTIGISTDVPWEHGNTASFHWKVNSRWRNSTQTNVRFTTGRQKIPSEFKINFTTSNHPRGSARSSVRGHTSSEFFERLERNFSPDDLARCTYI